MLALAAELVELACVAKVEFFVTELLLAEEGTGEDEEAMFEAELALMLEAGAEIEAGLFLLLGTEAALELAFC